MIAELEGKIFPDRPYRVCTEVVGDFIEVTGDDPDRWQQAAPPGFAAALLFVVAPELLSDPSISGGVVHGDQTFNWLSPLRIESDLAVTGVVEKVRTRGETALVGFSLIARDPEGPVVEGRSTFLTTMSRPGPSPEQAPVAALQRAATTTVDVTLPSPRSASRADLIRYAAATRDWNPIHWDHASAVDAGLGGVVVHGLLQSSWLTQTAALAVPGDRPLESARFRYTAPLRPGAAARIEGDLAGPKIDLRLVANEVTTVSGRFQVAS
ncbi:MAG TPA: MaoC family dehydratase [Acidimicrobiia bacterium]|nr:MaoC family dehydratase [Acidimicrobiia bacterium]